MVRRSHPRMVVSLAVASWLQLWWGLHLPEVNLSWPLPSRVAVLETCTGENIFIAISSSDVEFIQKSATGSAFFFFCIYQYFHTVRWKLNVLTVNASLFLSTANVLPTVCTNIWIVIFCSYFPRASEHNRSDTASMPRVGTGRGLGGHIMHQSLQIYHQQTWWPLALLGWVYTLDNSDLLAVLIDYLSTQRWAFGEFES